MAPHTLPSKPVVPAPPEGKKLDPLQKSWAFFVAYLTPRLAEQPTAVWGAVSMTEAVQPWSVMKPLLLRDDGPAFLRSASEPDWQQAPDRPEKVESLVYRACPLVSLTDSNVVERVVVNPLIERFVRGGR